MSTHKVHFHDKIRPKMQLNICFLELAEEFPWEFLSKQAIGVPVIDVLLYFHDNHRRVPNKADEIQARLSFQRLTS